MASSRPLVGLVPKRSGLYIGKIIWPFEVPNYYTMYYNPKVEENVKKKKNINIVVLFLFTHTT